MGGISPLQLMQRYAGDNPRADNSEAVRQVMDRYTGNRLDAIYKGMEAGQNTAANITKIGVGIWDQQAAMEQAKRQMAQRAMLDAQERALAEIKEKGKIALDAAKAARDEATDEKLYKRTMRDAGLVYGYTPEQEQVLATRQDKIDKIENDTSLPQEVKAKLLAEIDERYPAPQQSWMPDPTHWKHNIQWVENPNNPAEKIPMVYENDGSMKVLRGYTMNKGQPKTPGGGGGSSSSGEGGGSVPERKPLSNKERMDVYRQTRDMLVTEATNAASVSGAAPQMPSEETIRQRAEETIRWLEGGGGTPAPGGGGGGGGNGGGGTPAPGGGGGEDMSALTARSKDLQERLLSNPKDEEARAELVRLRAQLAGIAQTGVPGEAEALSEDGGKGQSEGAAKPKPINKDKELTKLARAAKYVKQNPGSPWEKQLALWAARLKEAGVPDEEIARALDGR